MKPGAVNLYIYNIYVYMYIYIHTRAPTPTPTPTPTRARAHARTHARTHMYGITTVRHPQGGVELCIWKGMGFASHNMTPPP